MVNGNVLWMSQHQARTSPWYGDVRTDELPTDEIRNGVSIVKKVMTNDKQRVDFPDGENVREDKRGTPRGRLVELLQEADKKVQEYILENDHMDWIPKLNELSEVRANYLIANGVIVPPCKVGDTVHLLDDIVRDSECCECEHYCVGGFGDPSECARTRLGGKHPDCIKIKEKVVTQHDIFYYLYAEKFGKDVFLTREEAEKALEKMKGGGE